MSNQQPLNLIRNQRGIASIWVALSLGMVLSLGALIVDGGQLTILDNKLQIAADVIALAAGVELPDEDAVRSKAIEYASKQMPSEFHGTVLKGEDVVLGNWDTDTHTFTPEGSPSNAVKITVRRSTANGNPVLLFLGGLIGWNEIDLAAEAITYRAANNNFGTRYLIDDEMIDEDVPSIQDLAASMGKTSEELLSDMNGDWFIDLPAGAVLEVPTGQVGDEGMFDLTHSDYPFSDESVPSHWDFLNYNDDPESWRQGLLSDGDLDPLPGVSPVNDPGVYETFNPDFVHVSPIYDSDINDLGNNEVNAKGRRKGLLAFKIIAAGGDPSGSDLPHLTIQIVDPATINLAEVGPWSASSTGNGKIRIVK